MNKTQGKNKKEKILSLTRFEIFLGIPIIVLYLFIFYKTGLKNVFSVQRLYSQT